MPPRLLLPSVFALAAGTTLVATPLVRAFARRIGMVSAPRSDRWHERPTALLGGVAIWAGCILSTIFVVIQFVPGALGAGLWTLNYPATGLLLAASLMFATGLVDDVKKFRPVTKLVLQVVAATIAISFGVVYNITPWHAANVIITLFWFLALTNALNLLDNMDGVAAGVAGIAATFLAANFAMDQRWLLSAICLALAGSAAGFLPYNFYRASVFMGDSGSLFLGSLLAALGALYPGKASGSLIGVLFVPSLIVIIPILDTGLVTVARLLNGSPVSQGGRDHSTHRLVAMGLSEKQVACLLYGFAIAGGGVSLVVGRGSFGMDIFAACIFLTAMSVMAAYLLRLHVYPANELLNESRLTVVVSDILYKRRITEVVMDLLLFAAAYAGAYLLRFDGQIPSGQYAIFVSTLALAIASKVVAYAAFGVYRGVWRHLGLSDLDRIAKAAAVGGLLTIGSVALGFHHAQFSRTVFLLDVILVLLFTAGARLSFRYLDMMRRTLVRTPSGTIIYGAGAAGELLVREAHANPSIALHPIGFIDDDPMKSGRRINGLPVLGTGNDLEAILTRGGVASVVLSTRKLDEASVQQIVEICRYHSVATSRLVIEVRPVWEEPAIQREQLGASRYCPPATRAIAMDVRKSHAETAR